MEQIITYRLYKNEFHPLFIAFIKGVGAETCDFKYNFFREVVAESENVLTIHTFEKNIALIQAEMFADIRETIKRIYP